MDAEMSRHAPDRGPRVSVCCAWYNRADHIRHTVDGLLGQNYDPFEIVLVNDGSPDPRVQEILDSYSDLRLKVIHQENTGFVRAIRRAIDESRGEYIAIQGAGDVSLPDRLRVQAEFLDAHADVIAVGCVHEQLAARTGRRIALRRGEVEASLETLRATVPFTQGTLMMRRDAYARAGGYDIAFRFCQDWDLYRRLVSIGRVIRIDQCAYQKLLFEDGASSNPRKRLQQIKFKHLVQLRDRNERRFECLRPIILAAGIDKVISDAEVINDCRRSQVMLLKSGEIAMAAEWCDIILSAEPTDRLQQLGKPLMRLCGNVKVIEISIGRLLELGRRLRHLVRAAAAKSLF